MNRFGKVPSSEIIRQAKQEIYGLVDTKRPETPRHPNNLTQEKWDYYGGNGGSGDKHTLDKLEPRPQTAKIRLDPLKPSTPPKNKKRAGSAQQKFTQCKDEYCRAKIKERHLCAEKLAKSIERLDGEMSSTDREQILTKCKEILDINIHLSNQQRLGVCRILLQMRLGRNNFDVLGDTMLTLSKDQSFIAEYPVLVNGVIAKYDTANYHFIEALSNLIQYDKTLHLCIKNDQLISQLRRCTEYLLAENDGQNEQVFQRVYKSFQTIRSLLDVTSFFALLEKPDSDSPKLVDLWIKCCNEFSNQRHIVHMCSRILSKSTESDVICGYLKQPSSSLVLASTIETYIGDNDILVRLLYAMGNCLASDIRCRQNNARLVQSIRRVFRYCCKRCDTGQDLDKQNTDVLLKMIRLVANFSLDESGAVSILQDSVIIKAILWLLKLSVEGKKLVDSPDVTKYCLAALNNLIFYAKNEFEPYTSDTTHAFINCLMKSNLLVTAECCRALGNLSHYPVVVELFESSGADKLLHTLLDSSDINLVVNVIGIFINFSLKQPQLQAFVSNDREGIFKLLVAMQEFNDWRLSTLTLQLIWNLLRNVNEIRPKLRSEISSTIEFINENSEPPHDIHEAQEQRLFGEISEKMMEIVGNR